MEQLLDLKEMAKNEVKDEIAYKIKFKKEKIRILRPLYFKIEDDKIVEFSKKEREELYKLKELYRNKYYERYNFN